MTRRTGAAELRRRWLLELDVSDLLAGNDPPLRDGRASLFFELGVVLLLTWLPWVAWGAYSYSQDPGRATLAGELMDILHSVGCLALLAYLAWRSGDWRAVLGLQRSGVMRELFFGTAILVATLLATIAGFLLASVMGLPSWDRPYPEYEEFTAAWSVAPLTMLLAATLEEALYRAYLWTRLTQLTKKPELAIIVSAVLFSLVHVTEPAHTISLLLGGIAYGMVFASSRSLWRLILAHWAFNLLMFYA